MRSTPRSYFWEEVSQFESYSGNNVIAVLSAKYPKGKLVVTCLTATEVPFSSKNIFGNGIEESINARFKLLLGVFNYLERSSFVPQIAVKFCAISHLVTL